MDHALVQILRSSLFEDMLKDLANSRRQWLAGLLQVIARPSVTRFAEIVATFDDYVRRVGHRFNHRPRQAASGSPAPPNRSGDGMSR